MATPLALSRLQTAGGRWWLLVAVAVVEWLVLLSTSANLLAASDEPANRHAARPRNVGQLLRIPGTITDQVDQRIRRSIDHTIRAAKQTGANPVIVLQIDPGRTEFGKAYDLARYLSGPALNGAKVIAYLPATVVGHNVLVALACDELVMRDEAEIGDAGKYEPAVEPPMRNAYVEIAQRRQSIPADLALGMLDATLEVIEVETEVSREFIRAERLPELKRERAVRSTRVVKPAGSVGLFSGRRGRELGFVDLLASSRDDIARVWQLPREALQDDPSGADGWRAACVHVKGALSGESVERVQNLVRTQINQAGVNFVCLWIDSPGGAPVESMNLANFLAAIDPTKQRIVAYIPREARGDAAFIALACDQIVMHPTAVLGGSGAAQIAETDVPQFVTSLTALAERKSRNPALAVAMVDENVTVFRAVRVQDGLVDYFTAAGLAEKQRAGEQQAWRQEVPVTRPGHLLQVDGRRAEELGMTAALAESFDDFRTFYGLERDPQLVEPNWVTTLVDALNSPGVSWLLLFLGGAALYAELHSPGVGLGGIVGAVCFMLYFWSAYLGGTAGWLEVLLFVSGVLCLLLEIFLFPGVAVFGFSGGLMIVVSLVLASQTFIFPRNEYQLAHLQTTLFVVLGAGVATVVAALGLNRVLPHTPMFNRMLLVPPSGEELLNINRRESLAAHDHLLGARGTTTTPLLPAGKARFGDELVDVMADGEFVERGRTVVVVEARGNRVLVRSVPA